jgi:hypothetical protein
MAGHACPPSFESQRPDEDERNGEVSIHQQGRDKENQKRSIDQESGQNGRKRLRGLRFQSNGDENEGHGRQIGAQPPSERVVFPFAISVVLD